MAYFQLGEQQLPLRAGSQRVAPDAGAQLRLPSGEPTASAVVVVNPDGSTIIQKAAADSLVKVNGVLLGAEPSPLIHGDHVEIGGHDLRFGDTKAGGSTQFVSSAAIADVVKARLGIPAKPTTATGGRLVSLVDGREYAVASGGLVIGRDPSADVVVPTTEVSRRHVQIAPAEHGYLLTDLSTNGVWVNGTRVVQQQVLGRGDVIKIANEEFRFYADVAKAGAPASTAPAVGAVAVPPMPAPPVSTVATIPAAPPPAPPPAAPPPPPAPLAAPPAAPAPVAAAPPPASRPAPPAAPPAAPSPVPAPAAPKPAAPPAAAAPPKPAPPPAPPAKPVAPPMAAPAAPAAPAASAPAAVPGRPALATLEVLNEGPDKGKGFQVRGPLTNIGRGAHNDLVIGSESVSDSHAKLQKREAGWYIVDIDSTNGTYVGGRRVKGEQMLEGAPDLRFGDVKVAFRPTGEARVSDKSTRAIAGVSVEEARRRSTHRAPAAAIAEPAKKSGGVPGWVWIVALAAIAAGAYFIFGRT